MTKQEQIEAMMLDVPQTIVAYDANPKGQHLYGEQRLQIAEILYDKGYRLEATLTSDFIEMVQRHAKIDVLNKAKEKLDSAPNGWAYTGYIDDLIEEVQSK